MTAKKSILTVPNAGDYQHVDDVMGDSAQHLGSIINNGESLVRMSVHDSVLVT